MEYLALYRKYRPVDLDEVVGQSEIKQILASSVRNNTITHAYLFSGPRGTGKTTMAKILAKMVNCESPVDGNACNKCNSCLNILNSNDVIEIDAASNNGVDEIRELREKANLVPTSAKYKIYIIDEVHMLTTQAFNALLKTLEEPPRHVIFILATTEFYKIPLTITSRCQKFQFNKLKNEEIVDRLKYIAMEEKIKITNDAINEIAKISDGGMRDSINFLDQLRSFSSGEITIEDVYNVCGNVSVENMVDLLINIKNNDVSQITSFFENIDANGKSYSKFLENFVMFLKDVVLINKNVNHKYIVNDIVYLEKVNNLYTIDEVFNLIDKVNDIIDKIRNVTRQSVFVLTKFLLIMYDFNKDNNAVVSTSNALDNNINVEISNKNDDTVVKEKNNEIADVNDSKKIEEINKEIKEESIDINREIIINNAFAVANKNCKVTLQSKMVKLNEYLTNKKYKTIVGLLVDTKIEVAGSNYIILSADSTAIVQKINDKYKTCMELLSEIFGEDYIFVVITKEEWEKYRDEYILNVKNGKEYVLKELEQQEKKTKKSVKKATVVDKLFELVGEDNIEFK